MPFNFPRLEFLYREYCTRLTSADRQTIKSKKTPILLVAGIYASARSLLPLKKFLEEHSWPVYLPSEKKNTESIPVLAQRLIEQIQKIPIKKIQIIAHSMGGLTALKALENSKINEKVERLITLGSPLRGCTLGSIAFWERNNRKFLKKDSAETYELSSDDKVRRKICTLRAQRDRIVFPADCTTLPRVRENCELPTKGHTSLILSPQAWVEIAKRLKD